MEIKAWIIFSALLISLATVSAAEDPYKVLGVRRGDSIEAIKKSYRMLAFRHHPDRVKEISIEEATKKMTAINVAYDQILKEIQTGTARPSSSDLGSSRQTTDRSSAWSFVQPMRDNWDDWGSGEWATGVRDVLESSRSATAQAQANAETIMNRVYSSSVEKWKKNYPSAYNNMIKELSSLIYDNVYFFGYEFKQPNTDPISFFVARLHNKSLVDELKYFFRFGNRGVNFFEGVNYLGVDPERRNQHTKMVGEAENDLYRAQAVAEENWQKRTAVTAFIYENFGKMTYIPKEAVDLAKGKVRTSGHGEYSGVQLAAALLPFLESLSMRNELLLHILINSGNAKEFSQVATIYLHEASSQQKYYSKNPESTTLAKAWGNVERALAARDDLQFKSLAHFKLSLYTFQNSKEEQADMKRFARDYDGLAPDQWLAETAKHEGYASVQEDLVRYLRENPYQHIAVRALAEKYEGPLKASILDAVKTFGGQKNKMMCSKLF